MDRKVPLAAAAAALLFASVSAGAASGVGDYKLDPSFLQGKHPLHVRAPAGNPAASARRGAADALVRKALASQAFSAHAPANGGAQFSGPLPGFDGIVNFNGSFTAFGLDAAGNPSSDVWFFSYVGQAPRRGGGSTSIGAPVIPVTVELLDADGNQASDPDTGAKLRVSPQDHVRDVLESPVFADFRFTSSRRPTQFTDAVHRATFFDDISEGWHTLLDPMLEPGMTLKVPFGEYAYALNADGSCCAFVLVDYNTFGALLFPPTFPVDDSTLMGAAELAGIATTRRITTLLFPDTYLFLNGNVNDCCVLGYHTFDEEPGTAKNGNLLRFYTTIYASWISPGLFGTPELGLQDVTALSHEMAETFADPFVVFDGVHNLTPWWLSGGQCQDDLEVGDVVESLPTDVTFPIAGRNGFLYHPQNVALLQWFAFEQTSTALGGAYSYPDPGALPALSAPIRPVFDSSGNLIACNPISP